jgi:serine carboxypeptidase-like clade 2
MTQSRVKNSLGAYVTCEDLQGILTFFNEPSIHIHLHVDFVNYDICSDEVADKYRMNSNASEWIYPYLIRAGLKILVYSGDVDANVPITGTLRWIERMKDVEGIPVVEPWREWWVKGLHKYEDQVGGMVWKLRGFTFASVRGAGHLVPADKRK